MSSLYFQPNQKAMDNFDTVDLSWLRHTMDPLKVLRHGVSFLEDPSKIDDSNCNIWCNLHITPGLEGVMVEVCSLKEPIGPRESAWGLLQTPWNLELLT